MSGDFRLLREQGRGAVGVRHGNGQVVESRVIALAELLFRRDLQCDGLDRYTDGRQSNAIFLRKVSNRLYVWIVGRQEQWHRVDRSDALDRIGGVLGPVPNCDKGADTA